MNIKLVGTLIGISLIACPLLYIFVGPALDASQLEVLKLLSIITGCSALFCFIVGEATTNNSQMDKLWSLLPIAYTWIIAAKGGMSPRLLIVLFLGSSAFAEEISLSKYPEYADYCKKVPKFFPGKRYYYAPSV